MAVENLTATGVDDNPPQNGFARSLKYSSTTVEVSAAASVSSKYVLGYLPSGARLPSNAILYWDDMATSGSPTIDLGLRGGSLTYDDDGINDGLLLSSASTGAAIIKSSDNYGKPLWKLAGLTSDPDEIWALVAVIRDAAVTAGGTLGCQIIYAED